MTHLTVLACADDVIDGIYAGLLVLLLFAVGFLVAVLWALGHDD
jgi:hypothetical protein